MFGCSGSNFSAFVPVCPYKLQNFYFIFNVFSACSWFFHLPNAKHFHFHVSCSSQVVIPHVSCRLYTLIQCPSTIHQAHSVYINMHDQLLPSTLSTASTLTHIFLRKCGFSKFSLPHPSPPLCVCTCLSPSIFLLFTLVFLLCFSASLSQH